MNRQQAIRRSFNRAAASYDAAATLQRQVCQSLLAALPTATTGAPATLLDAGCGTGYAHRLFAERWPQAEIVAADFAPAMLAAGDDVCDVSGVCADIEALPFAAKSFDLYWSSLTWQWCDIGRTMAEAARVLRPGGHLAVSSLAPGTLVELADAFAGADRHRHVLDFSPAADLTDACAAAGLIEVRVEQAPFRLYHDDLTVLLRELKALGANQLGGPRRPGLMGRHSWRAVAARYENFREAAGLPATYEVVLCTARKPIL